MLAARADQENAVHAHQTAAAAKPLNQGIRGLAAKTPGNRVPKTPFKVQLNDENTAFQAGKTNGKGQEKGLTLKKGGQLDKSAFVTPAGELGGIREQNRVAGVSNVSKDLVIALPSVSKLPMPKPRYSKPRPRRALNNRRRSHSSRLSVHACAARKSRSTRKKALRMERLKSGRLNICHQRLCVCNA